MLSDERAGSTPARGTKQDVNCFTPCFVFYRRSLLDLQAFTGYVIAFAIADNDDVIYADSHLEIVVQHIFVLRRLTIRKAFVQLIARIERAKLLLKIAYMQIFLHFLFA